MQGRLDAGILSGPDDSTLHEPSSRRRKEASTLVQVGSQRDWDTARLSRFAVEGRKRFDFLTAGTSGKTPQTLIRLMTLPVFESKLIVDIRANPHSQHTPDWNRSALASVAEASGIEYIHRPDLGVPVNLRHRLYHSDMSYSDFFLWYDSNVATAEVVSKLKDLLTSRPLFLCTELGPEYCHRHRLALAIEGGSNTLSFDL